MISFQLFSNGPVKQYGTAYLTELYRMIIQFTELHTFLSGDVSECYDPELEEMGVPLDECVLMHMNEIVESIPRDTLSTVFSLGYFGTGVASSKFVKAYTVTDAIITKIRQNCDYVIPFEDDEFYSIKQKITYALGDLIYVLHNCIYYPENAWTVIANPTEEFEYAQDIQQFFANIGMSSSSFAIWIASAQSKFASVVPLFESNLDAWNAIASELHPSLVDTLVDYGTYITSLDIRAYEQDLLKIDENYLDLIRARAENSRFIGNEYPDAWAFFLKLVPDRHISTILQIEDSLTPGLIEPAIQAGELTDAYVQMLVEATGGLANEHTRVFSN